MGACITSSRTPCKHLVDNGSAALLDQMNYAQGFVSGGKCSVADPNADLNTTYTAENSVSGRGTIRRRHFAATFISSRS